MTDKSKTDAKLVTQKITVTGMVQGIGYRPFVAELADSFALCGHVANCGGVVVITATGERDILEAFVGTLKSDAPTGAWVERVTAKNVQPERFEAFTIHESVSGTAEEAAPVLTADLATCSACSRELFEAGNRRFHYPFISCTACGPRYSILEALPYDRANTAMSEFKLCGDCAGEYAQKGGVRRHAQTIACHACGPKLAFREISAGTGEAPAVVAADTVASVPALAEEASVSATAESALAGAAAVIQDGGIVAVKDIGGFHLACSPFRVATAAALRSMKGRERKPFAVMFTDAQEVRRYCRMDEQEEALLTSPARPIVLLHREGRAAERLAENVCGRSPDVGAMLACNPLQMLLLESCGPLIMTSANRSFEPMITDNERMLSWLEEAARGLAQCANGQNSVRLGALLHDRSILTPLDDSIVRVVRGRRQTFRRARGMVPQPVELPGAGAAGARPRQDFAAGGDLKACFCYQSAGKAYLSQHFGDLEEEAVSALYDREALRMKRLFGFAPERFAADMHPAYRSVQKAAAMGDVLAFQHHHAHAASVMAEHGLTGRTLGVIFDGTGYGTDGTVWGGEFLSCREGTFERVGHLKPVRLPGGDAGAKNADAILCGYIASTEDSDLWETLLAQKRLEPERFRTVRAALQHDIHTVTSSSMGRLFDAVSALLDICHYNSYEGEAAIELEYAAAAADRAYPLRFCMVQGQGALAADTVSLFRGLAAGLAAGVGAEELAAGFLLAIAQLVEEMCLKLTETCREEGGCQTDCNIVLGGGCFQNRILLEAVLERLERDGFSVYINEQAPPGDGGICLGQAYLALLSEPTAHGTRKTDGTGTGENRRKADVRCNSGQSDCPS